MIALKRLVLAASSALRRSSSTRFLIALVALVALTPVLSGCGARVPVPDTPAQAITDGKTKEEAAQKAKDAKSSETSKLWNDVAVYYGSVAAKFPNEPTALEAARAEARVYSEELKNDYQGWQSLKKVIKSFGGSTIPELEPARADLQSLETKLDRHNATQPGYKVMDFVVRMFGNNPAISPVLAILFVALFVTAILHPLRYRQYKFIKEMQKFNPQIEALKQKHKDPMILAEKQREFYKENGVNQLAGCLPMLMQMPIFILMYQTILQYQFHFSQTSFLWINQAAAKLSLTWPAPITGAIGHHLGDQDMPLLIVYVASMFLQMKLAPPPTDPTQAEQQKMMTTLMPVFYFVMMLQWQPAAAFVLYWITSSLLGLVQQAYINKKLAHLTASPVILAADSTVVAAPLVANDKLISPKNRRAPGKQK